MSKSFFGSRKSLSKFDRKNEMSLQKPLKPIQLEQQKVAGLEQVNGNTFVVRHHGLVKQQVVGADPNVIMSLNIATQINGKSCRTRWICFKQVDYVIPGWTNTGFPNVLYLAHRGSVVYGYVNPKGETSKKLAALQLTEVSPVFDDSGVKTYDLRYTLRDSIAWGILPDVTKMDFEIYVDDEVDALELPLPNPITINLELRYERL